MSIEQKIIGEKNDALIQLSVFGWSPISALWLVARPTTTVIVVIIVVIVALPLLAALVVVAMVVVVVVAAVVIIMAFIPIVVHVPRRRRCHGHRTSAGLPGVVRLP